MIEINLLPGAGKKSKGRAAGASIGASVASLGASVKDPYLAIGVGLVVAGALAIGGMYTLQSTKSARLTEREQ